VVLQDYYSKQQQKHDTVEEKIKLVRAAAKLIKEDIKAIETAHEVTDISRGWHRVFTQIL
jgi:hypothetical protein